MLTTLLIPELLVMLAGAGQIALAVASLAIPWALGWRRELAAIGALTREVFWTYAGYICASNFCFGLLSVAAPQLLIDRSPLAVVVTAFIAAWWSSRLVIQFGWFHRHAPPGDRYRLAEAALVTLFAFFTATYLLALAWNLA